ncbi:MAG: right-handed parallel beta-helix repeat-containing protein [Planctomycetaceae bacterium]
MADTTTAIQSGDWHDPNTWDNGVPDAFARAIIGDGVTVTLNGTDHVAREIVVHGILQVAEDGQLTPVDGGFEDPVQPDNTFEQASGTGDGDLTGSAWTITAGAGITRNLSPFQNGGIVAPEGSQHGLIQGTGEFSQTVSGFESGKEYEFSLQTMARQSGAGGNSLEVILDAGLATEITLVDISEVTFDSFTEVVSPTFVAGKDSYTLTIKSDRDGGTLTGDRTTMVDDAQFRQTTVATKTLSADWIHVNSGGVFQVGSAADRFDTGEFIVTLTGTDQDANYVIETTMGTIDVNNNDGFLMTSMGGRLQFFGKDKITFTKLAATAEVGSNTITVENIIERNYDGTTSALSDGQLNWEVGDTIVVASSSYDYSEEEVRIITDVNNTGSQTILTLNSALTHQHYGEIETYGNGTRTWDIDLRAEVALLNRSITIQGTQDTDNSFGDRAAYGTGAGQNPGVGGHAMFKPGSGQITIDSARFDKMGQTATIGRYPIHWHVAGDRTGDILRNSSVTNSNNRGVTIHGAQNVLVEGNVLHDIHGHGFFMEDAAETGNEFLHNIVFGIHKVGGGFAPNDPFVVPGITRGPDGKVNGSAPQNGNGEGSHDSGQRARHRFVHSAAYWITNPDNTWVGNISAGSEGTGFWLILPDEVLGLSRDTGLYNSLNPRTTNLLQFDYNTAHSGQVGMTFDRGEDISGGPQSNGYNPPQLMQTNFFTGYKNFGTAVYHRGPDAIFNESRFADNAFSSFNTFSQQEHNVLFVGHSRGNAELETTVGGYRLYDGPGRIVDSHFAGFTADNAHSIRIEGGANKFSHTTAEGISFEDDGTADNLGIEIYGNNFISDDQTPVFVSGRPDSFSGLIYDVDGSLTGHGGGGAGYVLTPKIDFYRDSTDLTPAAWNGYISDDRFAQLRFGRVNTSNAVDNRMPVFRISNGDGHSIIADRWNGLSYLQRLYVKLNAGDYTIEFLNGIPDDGFVVHSDAKTVSQPGDSTVFRIVDAGQNYQPNQGTEVQSVEALRAAGSNAWFRAADGDLWMKVFESPTQIRVLPATPLVVTNTNDSGAGSLRAAITAANSNAGVDNIIFDIGAGGSTQTIQPLSPLPTITDRVYIDGTLQTFMAFSGSGFETAVQPNNSFELANGSGTGDLSGSPWSFTGGAGITRNLSTFQRSVVPTNTGFVQAPEGQQHALIQGVGSISQPVSGFEMGQTYDLNLYAMARMASDLGGSLQVTLDAGLPTEMTIVDIPEVTFVRFMEVVSSEFTATKSSYTLTVSSNPGANGLTGDRTTFVDSVQFRRTAPAIELDGSQAGVASGLTISAGGSGVKSLNINNFINGAGIHLHTAGSNVVENVRAGVDVDGTAAANGYGVGIQSADNTVIHSRLSNNTLDGIAIGGAASTGNTLSRNSISGNGDLGIDLNDDGVTSNDPLDPDTGANDLSNFPVLTQAETSGAGTTIGGSINGLANTTYHIELFSSSQLNASGHGEGDSYLATTQVTTDASGNASFSINLPAVPIGQFITATATDDDGNTSEFSAGTEVTTTPASIAGRHLFYNNSRFDDPGLVGDPTVNANDDGAIATNKAALQSGTTATFSNYSSYSRGINGVMVDIADAAGTITPADFEFRVGNTPDPSTWAVAPAHNGFAVRAAAGDGGSDRVTFTWADGAIKNQWLQVTVKANANTGLATPDVHYWGNQFGDTGGSELNTKTIDGNDQIGKSIPHKVDRMTQGTYFAEWASDAADSSRANRERERRRPRWIDLTEAASLSENDDRETRTRRTTLDWYTFDEEITVKIRLGENTDRFDV